MHTRRSALAALAVVLAFPAWAASLAKPEGRVLLSVTGDITRTNDGDAAVFDREMLESLDWTRIETFTHYTDGPQEFAGPTLASLLATLGVADGVLRAVALDDYVVDIPVSDLEAHQIILAMRHNGRQMRVRDKGPIWIIYPAANVDDIGERQKSHSIWQLVRIDVTR